MGDRKRVYAAATEKIVLSELDSFDEKWSGKYPKIEKSWRDKWANFSTYFKYPEVVRRLIYTTNTIEGFNCQLRKVTKSKTVFLSFWKTVMTRLTSALPDECQEITFLENRSITTHR